MATDGTSSPTFGLYLPQVHREFTELVALAQRAETCGFTAVWFMDHLALSGVENNILEGWTVATAVAALTSEIRIGHLVLCNSFRHPVLLGRMATTLDRISAGRLNLGLGWGSGAELTDLGVTADPPSVRRSKLAENIEIIEQSLTGACVDYPGRHVSVHDKSGGPPAVQQPVPLYIGGVGYKTLELVRKYADWWNCPSMSRHRLAELAPHTGPARISVNYSISFSGNVPERMNRDSPEDRTVTQAGVLVGSPKEISDQMRADRALGAEHFVIQPVDPASSLADVERFMSEVAPIVAQ